MAERTPNFAFSTKYENSKKISQLKRDMKALQKVVVDYRKKSGYDQWSEEFPIDIRMVTVISRLGKNSPYAKLYRYKIKDAKLYKHKSKTKRRLPQANTSTAAEHADHFDVYVRGTPILAGYEPLDIKDVNPKFDQNNLLHAEKGPAFAANGFAFYFWHGTQVLPFFITDKKKLTAEYIFSLRNAETRRIATEIVGWEKLLSEMEHQVIDKNKNPQIGTLIELEIPKLKTLQWGDRGRQITTNAERGVSFQFR
jgi:hypothetical protein